MSTVQPTLTDEEAARLRLAAMVRQIVLAGSSLAFAGLFAYVMYVTWDATDGQVPNIPGPVEGAATALAVALAAGFASLLALQPRTDTPTLTAMTRRKAVRTRSLLFFGVLLYIAVGAACGITYLANLEETPGLLRTVAIAFGGYVIAYLGTAYRQLSQ